MEISQLYAIIEECKKRSSKIQKEIERGDSEQKERAEVMRAIRQRRIEIMRMRAEVKESVKHKRQKQKVERVCADMEKQLRNSWAIVERQERELDQLLDLAQSMKNKIAYVDNKIVKLQTEERSNSQEQVKAEQSEQLQKRYWQLRQELQVRKVEGRQEGERWMAGCREREHQLNTFGEKMQGTNEEYKMYNQKIKIQGEIIDKIYASEQRSPSQLSHQRQLNCIKVLDEREQGAMQKRSQDLDVMERFEVESIMVKKQYERELEQRCIGRIVQQQSKSHEIGRIVNYRKRLSFNFTDIQKVKHELSKTKEMPITSQFRTEARSEREQKLEQNKRVRTHQTEMKKYSSQYRNILDEDQRRNNHGIEPLPESSILDIYEEIKAKPHLTSQGNRNIEIFKLIKFKNKRKSQLPQKGVAMECDK